MDGSKDIVTRVTTGLDRQPRGVFAYNYETGNELWHFLMGTCPRKLLLADIDRDNIHEIVAGTFSPDNGSDVNGTNDSTSYAIALDNSGDLAWKNPLGGVYSAIELIDITDNDCDGVSEIVAKKNSYCADDPEMDRISLLSG